MRIGARVQNSQNHHRVKPRTDEATHAIEILPKATGFGSRTNGGELLFLALATCYCNDIYREAARREIEVEQVEVEVDGDFGADGEPATNVTYRARVAARAGEDQIRELMAHTDRVAEIQNTVRAATPVSLSQIEVTSILSDHPGR